MEFPNHDPPFDIGDVLLDLTINDPSTTVFNDLTLIGRIVSNKMINFKAIKTILTNVWSTGSDLQISSLERNLFAYVFGKSSGKERVLATSPWSIRGHIVILQN